MPGAFSFDHDADFNAPVGRPSFYIPPSPSASSILSSSISRNLSSPALHCRKRPRIEVANKFATAPRGLPNNDTYSSTYSLDAPSPAPLVNTDYRIAGGLDTPTAEKLHLEERTQLDFEQDLRPNRYGAPPSAGVGSYFPITPSSVNIDIDDRRRQFSSSLARQKDGWANAVWSLTGGVAGRLFNFCWNTAFRGFHAGGGQGYHMQIDTPTVTTSSEMELKGSADVFGAEYRRRGSTPVPGGFPEENFIEDYMSRPQSHQQFDTPTQRHGGGHSSSLKGNWVMVNEPTTEMETSPAKKRVRPSTASTGARPISRGSLPMCVRPRLQSRTGASYASPRSSGFGVIAQTRPQSSESFQKGHKRGRSSVAQPRQTDVQNDRGTPKSPEVVKFEKKLRRKDQRQDESIHRLNQQMQDMIKEAQQALGSKVEVMDDSVDDEGYGEEADVSMVSRW